MAKKNIWKGPCQLNILCKIKKMTTSKVQACLLLISLLFSCKTITVNSDPTESFWKGKIKSVTQTIYYSPFDASGKWINGARGEKLISIYDDEGNLIQYREYNIIGDLKWIYNYIYFDKIKKLSVMKSWYSISGGDSSRTLSKNDSISFQKRIVKYDKKGNKIEEYERGESIYTYIYKYDDNGRKIEENYYGADSALEHKSKYQYDEKGNVAEFDQYAVQEGWSLYKTSYKRNKKGNCIELNISSCNDTTATRHTFEYLTYDKKGNWLKRVQYLNGKPKVVIERQIKYY
jgi:hypothetical protein